MRRKHVNIDKIISNVTATLAIEGLKPSKTAVNINRQFLEGKITSKEAVRRIKAKYVRV
ncbi:MAG: antitoxin VbhA family protein [Clostridia bacterium]|nr:antitoxin VbhA family protein [Clostridia bacterium]